MYTGSLHLHSLLRWVMVGLMIFLLLRSFMGRKDGRAFTAQDRKMVLFLMISAHLQLLIGLYQYFTGNWGVKQLDNLSMGEVMKNATSRFFVVEHLVGMLIAIVLITMANSASKKAVADSAKWNRLFWLYTVAFLLILACVPWPFREIGAGRSWLPGM
jgi:hypothetical protein